MKRKDWMSIAGITLVITGMVVSVPVNPEALWANARAHAGINTNKPEPGKVWHSETIEVKGPAYLNANTQGGSIRVKSHNRDEITIHIFVKRRGKYITEDNIPVDVTITDAENGVEVISKVARNGIFRQKSSLSVSYDILVPWQTEVRAQTSGGSVTASGIDHNVTLITSGGEITVEEISGDVLARTSGGPVRVRQVTGSLTARTSGGGIKVMDVTGEVNVRTSGGPISVEEVSGSIEARTSGGSITADIRAVVDILALSTSGGSITAYLPRNQGMDIYARGGSIQHKLDDLTGEVGMRHIEGSVGGGGIPVKIRTSGGSVRIAYRE